MKSLKEFKNQDVQFVFTDIDDTLTNAGLLSAKAFQSLWSLHQKGIHVVPITGRPAGWCELIARQWPVAGVVGENGGFYFRYHDKTMKRYYVQDAATRTDNQRRLERIRAEILAAVPGTRVASDQFCRVMDLAIDYCEDIAPLPPAEVDKIVTIFKKHGAQAKVSSIHVNGWFGEHNKLSTCRIFCQKEFQFDIDKDNRLAAFVGDSPNDEPMFEFFQNSFGVANVKKFLPMMKHHPQFVAELEGGEGFAQIAEAF